MWTIVILAVVAYIIKFSYDRGQQIEKINQEGGMLKKYEVIINRILEIDPKIKFFKVSSDSLSLGVAGGGGLFMFVLTQTFGKLTINWVMKSPFFGDHNLNWSFPEYDNQKNMIERVFNDLHKYQENTVHKDIRALFNQPSNNGFKWFSESEKQQIRLAIAEKSKKQDKGEDFDVFKNYTKDDFEYRTQLSFEKDFYRGCNMLEMYKMYFPEEEARLNEILEKLEDEFYDSDEYLNSLMAEILQDTIEHFKPSVQFSDFFYKTLQIMEAEVDISSYMKEEYEELLQYLLAQSKHEFAFSLICIYQKCYPQEAARLQEYADMLTGQ